MPLLSLTPAIRCEGLGKNTRFGHEPEKRSVVRRLAIIILRSTNMRSKNMRVALITAFAGLNLMLPLKTSADGDWKGSSLRDLAGEWQQWVLSIPSGANPLTDDTGANCMVGQRGDIWFLAGTFNPNGTIDRSCTIPEGTGLFFPVANYFAVDSPNVCGQGDPISVKDYRATAAAFVDGLTNVSVSLDGRPVRDLRRVKSKVFASAMPEDNVFDAFCGPEGFPGGIYSPSLNEGIYVLLEPLPKGNHTLVFHAEGPGFLLDATYHLTVVDVIEK
jgi:hypothetical protein